MTRMLNLADIQGNVTRAYGRFSFPFARYFFFHISNPVAGRKFVDKVRARVTTAARWPEMVEKPQCTVNIAFTYPGLLALQVPSRTLMRMSDAFMDGMKDRAFILGDRDATLTEDENADWDNHWDPIWKRSRCNDGDHSDDVHVWISLNAQLKEFGKVEPVPQLEEYTTWLRGLCEGSDGGVTLLKGNSRENPEADYLAGNTVFDNKNGVMYPTPREHFGFVDGIGDPCFKGQFRPEEEKVVVIGRGKRVNGKWEPIEAGEFVLGHPDESQEWPPTAPPPVFMQNGTYMAFRKLHENVSTFDRILKEEARTYAKMMGVDEEEAEETLRAKMCGRWSNGVPLSKVPTYAEWKKFSDDAGLNDPDPAIAALKQGEYLKGTHAADFRYADDMEGYKCPGGAHMRRVNTRDYLDPLNKPGEANENASSALNKRRRIARRGLPYGPPDDVQKTDETEQGVAMMILGTSLFRQFEFVQQQWIQYGLDFHQGNNTCPLLGDHTHHKRHTIPSDPKSGKPPYIMSKLETFVECRGGDYFFIPSMTALRMLAMGIIDPT